MVLVLVSEQTLFPVSQCILRVSTESKCVWGIGLLRGLVLCQYNIAVSHVPIRPPLLQSL